MEPGLIYDGSIPNSYLESVIDLKEKTNTKISKIYIERKIPSSLKDEDRNIGTSLENHGGQYEDISYCLGNMKKYNVVPGKSWGNLPKNMRSSWREHSCDVVFSLKRRKGYKMTNCPVSNFQNSNETFVL